MLEEASGVRAGTTGLVSGLVSALKKQVMFVPVKKVQSLSLSQWYQEDTGVQRRN